MYSPKSVLLERFNIVINKKDDRDNSSVPGNNINKAPSKDSPLFDKNYLHHDKSAESMEKLEKRMTGLEEQNDQLLFFINFLLDNLSDLVLNIVQSSEKHGEISGCREAIADEHSEQDESSCCNKMAVPCPTRREQEVLELLVKGYCAKEIASHLFISETTVITHKKNLKEKFQARNTVELISKAQKHLAKLF